MIAARQTLQSQTDQSFGSGVRYVLSALLCLALFLGQTMPLMAAHSSNAPLGWVEICGDDGSYFIQIGEDGEEQPLACLHCDLCLGPAAGTPETNAPWHMQRALPAPTTIFYSFDRSQRTDCPEQYWSACRGPPIVSTDNTMKTLFSLTRKELAVSALNEWGTPCV